MTLFISDKEIRSLLNNGMAHLAASLFCALFGAIYEYFSHGVYSNYMIYAFVIPLIFGTLPSFLIVIRGKKLPYRFALNAWNSGIAALTVGCILKGVLEIYGTTNRLIIIYPVAAALLLGSGLISYIDQAPAE